MKVLLDEMMPPAIAVELRARGHDVEAVAERADLRSVSDQEIFAFAQTAGRVVVTRDRADFLAIDRVVRAADQAHAGLVLVSSRYAPAAIRPVVDALDVMLAGPAPYPGFVHWL